MSVGSKVKVIISGLSMSGVSSITSLFVTGCYRGSDTWYRPNENWTRIQRRIKNLNLIIFDLSGETSFLDKATTELSPFIFKDTKILIYVIDLYDVKKLPQAKHYLEKELKCLANICPNYNLYIFLNKIDSIPTDLQEEVIQSFKDLLNDNTTINNSARYFITSLYTGSIFLAFDEVFWDILYSSSLNILLNQFKREFWSLTHSEVQDFMKKIMCIDSPSNLSIFKIGNEIIDFQDNIKEFVELNEPIFLEFGEGSAVDKTSINRIKYSLYQSHSFQKLFAFLLLFEMNEQAWNVIPIFDMLLENLILKRFQGEEISVKRDFVNPILPFLIQPTKFKIKSQQDEEIEKFSKFLDSHTGTDFVKVTLKELLIKFAQEYSYKKTKEEEPISFMSNDTLEEKPPIRPSVPSESIVTPQPIIQQSKEIEEKKSEPEIKKPVKEDIRVPLPPGYNKSFTPEEDEEVDLLSLPLRDVLRILREKE
ncbi:MAG: ADP-ribosylation factor-like protein [Candidatus Kariarchaeaceae archaeon]|jgi:hypothetical protein